MRWLGKVLGGSFGFLIGGPLGAIVGTAFGYQLDKGMEHSTRPAFQHDEGRVQMAFFTATFSVMGHIAKADGRVSRAEIELAESVMANMDLSDDLRRRAKHLFTEGKSNAFPLDETLDRFRHECHRRTPLIRMFIEIQLRAALADGGIHAGEEQLLLRICNRLRFSRFEFQSLKRLLLAQQRFSSAGSGGRRRTYTTTRRSSNLDDAYAMLGLTPATSDTDITRAYRRLISQNHPDKLIAKGLPEEMMKIATQKTQQIRKAYELIRSSRNNRR
jgi:DnaJ like chaperone protein